MKKNLARVQKKLLKKSMCFCLALTMTASACLFYPLPAIAQPEGLQTITTPNRPRFESISLPQKYGNLDELFMGSGLPGVIYVQDAHVVPDAQKSIREIILHFQNHYGLRTVALEGGYGKLEPIVPKTFPDQAKIETILNRYLEKGDFSGALMSSALDQTETEYWGIDDDALYQANVKAYLDAQNHWALAQGVIASIQKELNLRELEIFPRELQEIGSIFKMFDAESVQVTGFLECLTNYLKKTGKTQLLNKYVSLKNLLEEFDRKTLKEEQDLKTVTEFLQKEFSANLVPSHNQKELNQKKQDYETSQMSLRQYALYLTSLCEKRGERFDSCSKLKSLLKGAFSLDLLSGHKIFEEAKQLETDLKAEWLTSDSIRNLDKTIAHFNLFRKLLEFQLSRSEWEIVRSKPGDYTSSFFGRLLNKNFDQKGQVSIKNYALFYHLASRRDRVFHKNIKTLLKKTRNNLILFIGGGFHIERLAAMSRYENRSFAVISPKIKVLAEEDNYKRVMEGGVSWAQSFYKRKGKQDLYQLFSQALIRESLSQEGISAKQLLAWRNHILMNLAGKSKLAQASYYTKAFDQEAARLLKLDEKYTEKQAVDPVVERFLGNLKEIVYHGQVSETNLARLFRSSGVIPPLVGPQLFIPKSESRLPEKEGNLNRMADKSGNFKNPSPDQKISYRGRSEIRSYQPNQIFDSPGRHLEIKLSNDQVKNSDYAARYLIGQEGLLTALNILFFHPRIEELQSVEFHVSTERSYVQVKNTQLEIDYKNDDVLSVSEWVVKFQETLGWDFSQAIARMLEKAPHLFGQSSDFDGLNVVLKERMAGMGDLVFAVNTAQLLKRTFPGKAVRLIFLKPSELEIISKTKLLKDINPALSEQMTDGIEVVAGEEAAFSKIQNNDISIIYALGPTPKDVMRGESYFRSYGGKAKAKILIHELGFHSLTLNPLQHLKGHLGLGKDEIGMAPVSPMSKEFYSRKYPRADEKIRGERTRILKKFPGWELLDSVLKQTDLDRSIKAEWGFIYAHEAPSIDSYFRKFKLARDQYPEFASGDKVFFVMTSASDKEVQKKVLDISRQEGYVLFSYSDDIPGLQLLHAGEDHRVAIILDYSVPRKLFGELFLYSDDLPTVVTGQDNLTNILYLNQLSSGRPFFWEILAFQYDALFNFEEYVRSALGDDALTRLRGMWQSYNQNAEDSARMFAAPREYRQFFKQIAESVDQHPAFISQLYYLMLRGAVDYPIPKERAENLKHEIFDQQKESKRSEIRSTEDIVAQYHDEIDQYYKRLAYQHYDEMRRATEVLIARKKMGREKSEPLEKQLKNIEEQWMPLWSFRKKTVMWQGELSRLGKKAYAKYEILQNARILDEMPGLDAQAQERMRSLNLLTLALRTFDGEYPVVDAAGAHAYSPISPQKFIQAISQMEQIEAHFRDFHLDALNFIEKLDGVLERNNLGRSELRNDESLLRKDRLIGFEDNMPLVYFLQAFGIDIYNARIEPFGKNSPFGRVKVPKNIDVLESASAVMISEDTRVSAPVYAKAVTAKNVESLDNFYLLTFKNRPAALVWALQDPARPAKIVVYRLLSAQQAALYRVSPNEYGRTQFEDGMREGALKEEIYAFLRARYSIAERRNVLDVLEDPYAETPLSMTSVRQQGKEGQGFAFPGTYGPWDDSGVTLSKSIQEMADTGLIDFKNKKVIDIGSGAGNQTVLLAKLGAQVYGYDITLLKVKNAEAWVRLNRLQAKAKVRKARSVKELPAADAYVWNVPTFLEEAPALAPDKVLGYTEARDLNIYIRTEDFERVFTEIGESSNPDAMVIFRLSLSEDMKRKYEEWFQKMGWEIKSVFQPQAEERFFPNGSVYVLQRPHRSELRMSSGNGLTMPEKMIRYIDTLLPKYAQNLNEMGTKGAYSQEFGSMLGKLRDGFVGYQQDKKIRSLYLSIDAFLKYYKLNRQPKELRVSEDLEKLEKQIDGFMPKIRLLLMAEELKDINSFLASPVAETREIAFEELENKVGFVIQMFKHQMPENAREVAAFRPLARQVLETFMVLVQNGLDSSSREYSKAVIQYLEGSIMLTFHAVLIQTAYRQFLVKTPKKLRTKQQEKNIKLTETLLNRTSRYLTLMREKGQALGKKPAYRNYRDHLRNVDDKVQLMQLMISGRSEVRKGEEINAQDLDALAMRIIPYIYGRRLPLPQDREMLENVLGIPDNWSKFERVMRQRAMQRPYLPLAEPESQSLQLLQEAASWIRGNPEQLFEWIHAVTGIKKEGAFSDNGVSFAIHAPLIPDTADERRDFLTSVLDEESRLILPFERTGGQSFQKIKKDLLADDVKNLGDSILMAGFRPVEYVQSVDYAILEGKAERSRGLKQGSFVVLMADGSLYLADSQKQGSMAFLIHPEVLNIFKLKEIISILKVIASAPEVLRQLYREQLGLIPNPQTGISPIGKTFLDRISELAKAARLVESAA